MKCITMLAEKPKVLAPGMYAIDLEPIPPRNRNNREVHLDYLTHLKERVKCSTEASGSKPRSNTKKNRIQLAKSDNNKKVKDHPRNNKSNLKQMNRVDSSISYKRKLFTNVGYQWKPTGKKFTLGEQCPLTRFTKSKVVPLQQHRNVSTSETVITERLSNNSHKPLTRYKRRNKRTPTEIGDPIFQTLHPRLFSNASRTDRPLETDIRQKDEKSSQKRQNRARNGKAWKSQSQIEAKVNPDKVKAKKSSSQRKYNFRDQICQILKLYNKDKYYKD
ncbi:hypothetical protein Tco_0025434 [Tanacetum coccineum]